MEDKSTNGLLNKSFLFCDSDSRIDRQIEAEDGSDLGEAQDLAGGSEFGISMEDIKQHIIEARAYMESNARKSLEPEIVDMCKNEDTHCAMWR